MALLAFWLQLGLSFGHIHPSDIYRFGHPVAPGHGVSELAVVHPRGPVTPIPAFPDTSVDVTCAICVAAALAASAVPSEPPRLRPPEFARSHYRLVLVHFVTAAPHRHFRARAPPQI
jgi:hypothetical protein